MKNKLILQTELQDKQQQSLKCIEFATQYMLKLAQYRILNPLHNEKADFYQINKLSDIMVQLNTFTYPKTIERSLNKSISKHQNTLLKIQPPKLQMTEDKPLQNKQILFKVEQTISKTISDQQQNQSIKSSTSSKKIKRKFEQITKNSNTENFTNKNNIVLAQKIPSQAFNFKKNKGKQEKVQPHESKINIKDEDQQDSFDNFPLIQTSSQHSSEIIEASLHSSDFALYNSSIISNPKKDSIGIVSEHSSQHQLSQIHHGQQTYQNQKSILSLLSHQEQLIRKTTENLSEEQLSKYLMKLQSFEIQQQILFKKVNKTWNRQFDSINKIKNIQWSDLNLPKPSYQFRTFEFAKIIE